MPNRRTPVALAAAILAAGALPACTLDRSTAQGAAAVYSPFTGNLSTIIEADLDTAYAAARGAVGDMHLTGASEERTDKGATVKASAPDGGDVEIDLSRESDTSTAITVAVGPLGREALARDTLDKVLDRIR